MATKAELATKVLQKLGIVAQGQSPDSADSVIVEDAYDSAYYYLRACHLVTWGGADEIPDGAVLPVRDFVASRVAEEFGKSRTYDSERLAKHDLAALIAADNDGQATQTNYY